MPESFVNVTEGSGKKLHSWQRVIGANTVEDEAVFLAEFAYPTFTVFGGNVSVATLDSHVIQIMAGSSLVTRVRRITIEQNSNATAVAVGNWGLFRVTTAGTGGTTVTARPHDSADSAFSGSCQTLPTAKGTEGVELNRKNLILRQAILATAAQPQQVLVFEPALNSKPYIIPAGTSNGLVLKNLSAVAGATVNVTVEFVETSFL